MAHILVVDDEPGIAMALEDDLALEGHRVTLATDGIEASRLAQESSFDLILLDVMLPGRSGLVVCQDIRKAGLITPILMLTALGQTSDKVAGLKIGADDYVTKPFHMQELMARVEALLRRSPVGAAPRGRAEIYELGNVRVDLRGTEATRDGDRVNLSAREFQLLRYFIEHAGATLSREELLTQVWGYSGKMFTRTVDVHVASLRQKLEPEPKTPRYFLTVQGLGYKFKPQ